MINDMDDVEQVKLQGAKDALRSKIWGIQRLIDSKVWSNTEATGRFVRLEEAMSQVEARIQLMRTYLEALQELDPENK